MVTVVVAVAAGVVVVVAAGVVIVAVVVAIVDLVLFVNLLSKHYAQ